jgi:hypothetical protein
LTITEGQELKLTSTKKVGSAKTVAQYTFEKAGTEVKKAAGDASYTYAIAAITTADAGEYKSYAWGSVGATTADKSIASNAITVTVGKFHFNLCYSLSPGACRCK